MSGLIDLSDSSRLTRPPQSPKPWGKLLVAAGLAAGVGAVLPSFQRWTQEADLLPIERLVVEGAAEELVLEIETYAAVKPGSPLFSVDLQTVATRVETHPYVRRATVRWSPPDALVVKVAERSPAVAVALGSVYLADAEGALFKKVRPGDPLDLPVVTGVAAGVPDEGGTDAERGAAVAKAGLDLLAAHRAAGAPGGVVHEVHVGPAGARLHLEGDLTVHLGEAPYDERLGRLAELLARLEAAGQRAAVVHLDDVRRPERVAVRLRPRAEMPGDSARERPRERQGREG